MSSKRKEKIIDIDAEDVGNDLAVVEYVEEIYKFYKSVEVHMCIYIYICLVGFDFWWAKERFS